MARHSPERYATEVGPVNAYQQSSRRPHYRPASIFLFPMEPPSAAHEQDLGGDDSITPEELPSSLSDDFVHLPPPVQDSEPHQAIGILTIPRGAQLRLFSKFGDCYTIRWSGKNNWSRFSRCIDVLMLILEFLSPKEMARLSRVNQRLHRVCSDNVHWARFARMCVSCDTPPSKHTRHTHSLFLLSNLLHIYIFVLRLLCACVIYLTVPLSLSL